MARLCRHLDFLESFLKNDRDHVKHLRPHKIEVRDKTKHFE